MIDGINSSASIGRTSAIGAGTGAAQVGVSSGASFADLLGKSIDEVSRLQQDASQATQDLLAGKTDDVTGVFTAMEKSDVAFKTLLAIRSKLLDAYEEIKNMPI